MPIALTTDSELRNLIFQNPKVIVKFTKTDCPICERMGSVYEKFSHDPKYNDITFLLMDAAENPVSSKKVNLSGTPFFAIYQNSILTQCNLVSNKEDLKKLLDELH